MVSYVHHAHQSSPRHVSFMPIPIYSRQCHDDELYVMKAFEKHASHCSACFDPLRTHAAGSTLCAKGHARAIDVAQYVYSKDGLAYSLVDRKANQRVRLELPASLAAVKSLLSAWEQGMKLLQPVKRSEKAAYEAQRQEKSEKARASKASSSARPRQPTHLRTGSTSSSDYDLVYTYGDGYGAAPTPAYYHPDSMYQPRAPQHTSTVFRVAPGSSTAQPISGYYGR